MNGKQNIFALIFHILLAIFHDEQWFEQVQLLEQAQDAGMPRKELLSLIDSVYGKEKEELT